MSRGKWLKRLALFLMLCSGGLLAYNLSALLDLQDELGRDLGENMVWAAGQASYQGALSYQASIASIPGHRGNLALQRQLLKGRMAVLLSPTQTEFMKKAGVLEQLVQINELLKKTDLDYAQLQTDLHDIGRKIMLAEREQAGERRDAYKHLMRQLILSIVCVMLSGFVLCAQLFLSMRASRQAHTELTLQHEKTRSLLTDLERERSVRLRYRDFVSLMSHQLRTPLAVIDSSAQRLLRQTSDTSLENPVVARSQRIRLAVGQLNRLVGRLLDGLRLDESGALEQNSLLLSRCVWSDVVNEAVDRFADTLEGRELKLYFPEAEASSLVCDRLWCVEILVNLLSNAHKYSPLDQPIEVNVWQDNQWLHCSVRDHGAGIAEGEFGRIFERFYRSSGTQHLSGVGLGLAIAQTLAQWQNGNLSVHNAEDGGAVFTLALPIREEVAP